MKHFTFDDVIEVIARAIIMLTILIPLIVIDLHSETDSKSTPQASVSSCEFCEGTCKLFHRTACETNYNTPNYYYLTYRCEVCGNEFTIEIIQEQKS